MRALAGAFLLLATASAAIAADPTPEEQRKLFQETLAQSRLAVEMKDGRLSGPGAQFLLQKGRDAQYVLVGEEHGVATIAETIGAVFSQLNGIGYRHLAIEVDPWMASKMEGILRGGGTNALAAFLAGEGHQVSLPFYGWSAETALADAVVKANRDATPALWGLEQVFIGAAFVLFEDIATGAKSAEARTLATALAKESKGNMEFLAKVDLARLQALRTALGSDPLARLVDDMILSARIYQPFTGGQGLSGFAANLERENLMKRLFLARLKEAEARGRSPKVMFKFGANHTMRGLSTTHIPSLGNFVADYALARGQETFHLLVLCGPGSKASDFLGNEASCGFSIEESFPDLAGHIDATKPTLFDLKPWKDKSRRWAHLPADVKELVWAYDAVLFVPNGKRAQTLK